MPLCVRTKLVPGDKGEYDKDGAESQFQSSCLAVIWLSRGKPRRNNKTCRSGWKLRFCFQRELSRMYTTIIYRDSWQNAKSISLFFLTKLLAWSIFSLFPFTLEKKREEILEV